MQPSETRLINAISNALCQLSESLDEKQRGIVFNIQIALTELFLRQDSHFIDSYKKESIALHEEGVSLLKRRGIDSEVTTISSTADLDTVVASISAIVKLLSRITAGRMAVAEYLAKVVSWENSLYGKRQQVLGSTAATLKSDSRFNPESIKFYIQSHFPDKKITAIENMTTLAGGFSKTTVLFDTCSSEGKREAMVIRAEQPLSLLFLPGARVANEFNVLKLMYEAGIPVAEPLWLESDGSIFGEQFLVSRKAKGQNLGSRVNIQEAVSTALLRDFIRNLVRIHQTDISAQDSNVLNCHLREQVNFTSSREAIAASLTVWRAGIDSLELPPSPLLERVLAWLEQNVPDDDSRPALLHGDYGLHNILVEDNSVTCILDWEGAGMGHPAEDVAWLLDGLGSQIPREQIISLYEEESGRQLPEFALRYFEVFNALKFAVICPTALTLFENHDYVGIDACQLGLFFTHFGTGKLNSAIAAAESVRSN